jgi:hypothetical protein
MSSTVVRPGRHEMAIFGFGSLCSVASMEQSLGRKYDRPYLPCELAGWRRGWDVAMPNKVFYAKTPEGTMRPENILYLNIRRQQGATVNGTLFIVRTSEIEAFDRREWIYDRVDVTQDLRGVQVLGGQAVAYVAKSEYVMREVDSPRIAAVRATYLRIMGDAFRDLGEFRAEFDRTSDPVPEHLVIEDFRDPSEPSPFGYKESAATSGASSG